MQVVQYHLQPELLSEHRIGRFNIKLQIFLLKNPLLMEQVDSKLDGKRDVTKFFVNRTRYGDQNKVR